MYIAKQFQNPEQTEVLGNLILSLQDNLESYRTDAIFRKYGYEKDSIQPDEWYSGDILFDIYKAIKEEGGSMPLVAMGKASVEPTIQAFNVDTSQAFLMRLPDVSTMYVRNAPDEYGFNITKINEKHYKAYNNTPVPNDVFYGAIWESVRVLKPKNAQFSVRPIKNYPNSDEGVVIEIEWD